MATSGQSAPDLISRIAASGIRPSAQRVAVAGYVLVTAAHPSADAVWQRVKGDFPLISRATVYNTLKLFVDKGLLRELTLAPGHIVYDPNLEPHHHFIDDDSGAICDLPWSAIDVARVDELTDLEVREYSVVLRGRRRDP